MSNPQETKYNIPPEPILSMAEAELAPLIRINTAATIALLLHRRPHKSLEELAQKELRLAGLRINPENNMSSRESHYYKITILDIASKKESDIEGLPQSGRFCRLAWNYAQDKALVVNIEEKGIQTWLIDIAQRKAIAVGPNRINGNISNAYVWLKDDSFLLSLVPENRPSFILEKQHLPAGPVIAQNDGSTIETRTYQDLLKNETDALNFELAATSEIWKWQNDGTFHLWKHAAMHDGIQLSPDGNCLLISEIKKPFSYFVPFERFPYHTFIYDLNGNPVYTVELSPLLEYLPQGFMAVPTGRRQIKWRSDQKCTLLWVEALDDGNPEKDAEFRDAIYELDFPFHAEPLLLFRTKLRFAGIIHTEKGKAVIYERWWKSRKQITHIVDFKDQDNTFVFDERNFQDIFNDPGQFVVRKNKLGWNVIQEEDNGDVYLTGNGYYEHGRKSFFDLYNLKNKQKTRLWEADDSRYQEDISIVLNASDGLLLTLRQDAHTYPSYYIQSLKNKTSEEIRPYPNPFKALDGVHQTLMKYKRNDGTELTAKLYLPADLHESQTLPLIMWAYPLEYKDKQTAGQNTLGRHDFIYPFWGSPLYWVSCGYAVMEDVSFPVIGEGSDHPNDHFHEQMIANAEAAVEAAGKTGKIDTTKIAIGGHSYGAFMVAYLLTHTKLFAAGIARSGAYNRTLTPFGFQSEERNLWQAKEVYQKMNPFLDAEKMKTPLLLIHGQDDNNSGTYTIQTERYYAALKALGATVRMVILPFESHSYQARESILHVLWEQNNWFEKYLK